MKRLKNAVCRAVIATIRLRVSSISNENTFERMHTNFSICRDVMKNECTCANFVKVRKVRLMTIENFKWSAIVQGADRHSNKQISSCFNELIPAIFR